MRKPVQLHLLTRPEQRGLQDKLPVTDEWVRRLLRREGLTPAQYWTVPQQERHCAIS